MTLNDKKIIKISKFFQIFANNMYITYNYIINDHEKIHDP